jgi:hypothetical protein
MVTPAQLPRLSLRDAAPEVRKAREGLLERGAVPVGVRRMVADSWLRSAAAGVNADSSPPPVTLAADLLADYRAEHPLAGIFPLLYDVAGRAAEDCESVLAVADERGQLLWVCGKPAVLRRAESIGFVEGAQWDERHAGHQRARDGAVPGRPGDDQVGRALRSSRSALELCRGAGARSGIGCDPRRR